MIFHFHKWEYSDEGAWFHHRVCTKCGKEQHLPLYGGWKTIKATT